eukprot:843864_1
MGNELSLNTTTNTPPMERESSYDSYSSTLSTQITMRISSLDEEINIDEMHDNKLSHFHTPIAPSPIINELNECNNMMDENGNITINSYCYCDCNTAFVVVTKVLNNGYKIIDLFGQRERMSYSNKLTLINDINTLKIAQ